MKSRKEYTLVGSGFTKNTLAFYNVVTITTVKSFVAQDPELQTQHNFPLCINKLECLLYAVSILSKARAYTLWCSTLEGLYFYTVLERDKHSSLF